MQRYKYTIYTENTPELVPLLDSYLDGYNILIGIARWEGHSEQSAIITVIQDVENDAWFYVLASKIITKCRQREVWFDKQIINLNVITEVDQLPVEKGGAL
jgi:hypothetical protein